MIEQFRKLLADELLKCGWTYCSPSDDQAYYYRGNSMIMECAINDSDEESLRSILKEWFNVEIDERKKNATL